MIILDTNVVSEAMTKFSNSIVLTWFDVHRFDALWTTAVSIAELLYGIERLPEGRKKVALHEALRQVTNDVFASRILNFDLPAARHYSVLVSHRFSIGRPISVQDAQIAAICLVHGATLATRNIRDFEETGVKLVNPWDQ